MLRPPRLVPVLTETGSSSHMLRSKQPPSSFSPDVDDNFAFIEQLLDTLQAEGDEEEEKPPEIKEPEPSCEPSIDAGSLQELQEALELSAALDPSAGSESWTTLINRFCEDGDESIVEKLLDNFLRSTSDAGNLIDAIGKKGLPPSKPVRSDLRSKLHLDLGVLRTQEVDTACLDPWEALLSSARGILQQSARTSQSPLSMGSLSGSLGTASPCSAASPSMQAQRARVRPGSKSRCLISGSLSLSGELAACDEGDEEVEQAKSKEERQPDEDLPIEGSLSHPSRAEILARLAAADDPDAMRSFLRTFLLGVRHRCLSGAACEAPTGSELLGQDDPEGMKSGYASSVWTCRSVETVNSVQSVITDFAGE
eukprot:gb/GFBE01031687.1/.p1 GENE.gb/GFBE01031687.1/~~gb/GFBE01031687.1/.p1  ORF type:complete len:368 (+),score=84.96 gb/GFBE01031687.1/:1-1104(+)